MSQRKFMLSQIGDNITLVRGLFEDALVAGRSVTVYASMAKAEQAVPEAAKTGCEPPQAYIQLCLSF
jgi:hypothetical protein